MSLDMEKGGGGRVGRKCVRDQDTEMRSRNPGRHSSTGFCNYTELSSNDQFQRTQMRGQKKSTNLHLDLGISKDFTVQTGKKNICVQIT